MIRRLIVNKKHTNNSLSLSLSLSRILTRTYKHTHTHTHRPFERTRLTKVTKMFGDELFRGVIINEDEKDGIMIPDKI